MRKTVSGHIRFKADENGDIWYKGEKLRQTKTTSGYKAILGHYLVHRFVCKAFNGRPLPEQTCCRHLNGIKTDNRPENLAWGTHKDNCDDSKRLGEHRGKSKLTEEEIITTIQMLNRGSTPEEIKKTHNISISRILRIKNGEDL
jgi:hypothetical protein